MQIHIAIPEPTSPQAVEDSAAYNQRSLPQYLHAIISAGAIPIPIPLHESPQRVAKILSTCQGICLPGSGADIDPQKYGESSIPECAPPDPARSAVDELLIQDAFNLHKPILGICYGTQALNVWCNGTLYQDLATQTGTPIDHAPGRTVLEAHPIQVTPNTRLAALLPKIGDRHLERSEGSAFIQSHHLPEYVNSSHHQAIHTPGDNLIVSAISPQDKVIEAVELASSQHFVLAVQWHPERTYDSSQLSRNIFHAFITAAQAWQPRRIEESVLQV
jgi:putative glutamine amidotransferase